MQELRQAAELSPHASDKIAAQLVWMQGHKAEPAYNARPKIIDDLNVPITTKIANRSLFVHAETRALLNAEHKIKGAVMLLTDPFCPNCAKQMAIEGVSLVVIDHQGFTKPYFTRNEEVFWTLSMSIADYCNVEVVRWHEDGELEILKPKRAVVTSYHPIPKDRATLPVSSWLRRHVRVCAKHFVGEGFTEKYDDRVESLHAAIFDMAYAKLRYDGERPVRLTQWPRTPRPFIDALECGIQNYEIQGEAPAWAADLRAVGITVTE